MPVITKQYSMSNALKSLNENEIQTLTDALPLIAILIGKADNNLDVKELDLAKKITHIRTFNSPEYLQAFYEKVEEHFDQILAKFNAELPEDAGLRGEIISGKLAQLNPVLAKLHPKAGAFLYRGFVRFSQEIAKASGGFLGFLAVNPEESKWVSLPMINPVEYEDQEDGDEEE